MSNTNQKPLTLEEATKPVTTEPVADVKSWQDAQTRRAIKEADASDFATAQELKATVRKFVPNG